MTGTAPTRITIEVHPPSSGVQPPVVVRASTGARAAVSSAEGHQAIEREASEPAPYQPAPCTCLDDGGCERDHETD